MEKQHCRLGFMKTLPNTTEAYKMTEMWFFRKQGRKWKYLISQNAVTFMQVTCRKLRIIWRTVYNMLALHDTEKLSACFYILKIAGWCKSQHINPVLLKLLWFMLTSKSCLWYLTLLMVIISCWSLEAVKPIPLCSAQAGLLLIPSTNHSSVLNSIISLVLELSLTLWVFQLIHLGCGLS